MSEQDNETRSKRSERERKDVAKHPLETPAQQAANEEPKADKRPEEPKTEASGVFEEERGGTPREREAVKEIAEAHPTRAVRLLNGWFDANGKKHPRGSELELPIEDARFLVESAKAEII